MCLPHKHRYTADILLDGATTWADPNIHLSSEQTEATITPQALKSPSHLFSLQMNDLCCISACVRQLLFFFSFLFLLTPPLWEYEHGAKR